jgi:hypothetical protein
MHSGYGQSAASAPIANFPCNTTPPLSRRFSRPVVSHFRFLGQHTALRREFAAMRSVKDAPQGQVVGSVFKLMLGPRGHDQDVA